MIFYNPTPLNVINIQLEQYYSNSIRGFKEGYVSDSKDGTTWVRMMDFAYTGTIANRRVDNIVMTANILAFKYHKITCTKAWTEGTSYYPGIISFDITAYTYDDELPLVSMKTVSISDAEHQYMIKY